MSRNRFNVLVFSLTLAFALILPASMIAQLKQWTIEDMMRFESLDNPVISENGSWVAHGASPDRGDGRALFYRVGTDVRYKVERGQQPLLSRDGRWGGAIIKPDFRTRMLSERDDIPDDKFALVNLSNGHMQEFEKVRSADITNNGNWLVLHHTKEENDDPGSKLLLKYLRTGEQFEFENVTTFTVDSLSTALVYAVSDTAKHVSLKYRNLRPDAETHVIHEGDSLQYFNFSWHEKSRKLAFLAGPEDNSNQGSELYIFNLPEASLTRTTLASQFDSELRTLNSSSRVSWRDDGESLFVGLAVPREPEPEKPDDDDIDLFDIDYILSEKELDVWHWDDPLIKTHEKETFETRRNRTYLAHYHPGEESLVKLAGPDLPVVTPDAHAGWLLGRSDLEHRQRITWEGWFFDFYMVNTHSGERIEVGMDMTSQIDIAPYGSRLVYFADGHWHLFDADTQTHTNLTENLPVSFANEDFDRTTDPNGYGIAGWVDGDRYVMIYDKFDIWHVDTENGEAERLTNGRPDQLQFRAIRTERGQKYWNRRGEILLRSYHDREKYHGFYRMRAGSEGTEHIIEDRKRFRYLDIADDGDLIFYTREDYREFPNVWVSDRRFRNPQRVSDLNMDITDYNWGNAELMEWIDQNGNPVQGIVIKPEDFDENKQYPVLVYYYERFSQRLHHFNEQVVNHRPSFPKYVSDGYVVFLPDVWFLEGLPGKSAVNSLVPGVQMLISEGIAHPDKIGLHGHSWSGYLSAYVVTRTDIFAAAVAGAPVSNMTSAYSGIRWGSGLARQFQYETGQSRIGGSMWERRDLYIENSPVFFADRINTPLLIQFGDKDEAVPWEQGIELYLALRRNQKDAIMLQYRGEPHHLGRYAHKLDYTIKMKEYFDHYLRGAEAPEWITDGIPYSR